MGTEEDIERLRNDVSGLYEENKAMRDRLTKLEQQGCSWDDKIDELKASLKELSEKMMGQLAQLSVQITTLINAPAQKTASRVEELVRQALGVLVVAFITYVLAKGGLK